LPPQAEYLKWMMRQVDAEQSKLDPERIGGDSTCGDEVPRFLNQTEE